MYKKTSRVAIAAATVLALAFGTAHAAQPTDVPPPAAPACTRCTAGTKAARSARS